MVYGQNRVEKYDPVRGLWRSNGYRMPAVVSAWGIVSVAQSKFAKRSEPVSEQDLE